jgi:16S rRNA (guanine527-N7)-methyltransferase
MMALRQAPPRTVSGWGSEQTEALDRGLRELCLQTTAGQSAALRRYGELLLKWNRTYNLLGATTAATMLEDHLLDSLAVLPVLASWIPPGPPALVDVGTGAGLPGLVLAIVLPHVPIVLVEPIGKKAAFLRQVVAECRLSTVTVLEARIEDVSPRDIAADPAISPHFICRAFTSLGRFTELCAPLLRDASLLFAMKAARVSQELQQLSSAIEVLAVEPLRTVEKDVQRNLVVMRSKESHPASDLTRPPR